MLVCGVQVQEVVLVEVKDAHVQHAANVRIILEQIAPSALLTVLTADLTTDAPKETGCGIDSTVDA